jgi:predicted urease superfamily metal-dependent hydrolase
MRTYNEVTHKTPHFMFETGFMSDFTISPHFMFETGFMSDTSL